MLNESMEQNRKRDLSDLELKLGYKFQDILLLDAALRHSSYVNEPVGMNNQSNERLEFLGDAVLELVVTLVLFQNYPQGSEGQLNMARSGLVKEASLAGTARNLGLGEYLLLGRGEETQNGRDKTRILADALEAVLAAVFLDGGIEAASLLVKRIMRALPEETLLQAPNQCYKTRLWEREGGAV